MLQQAVAAFWIAVQTVFCNCRTDQRQNHFVPRRPHYSVSQLAKLPTRIGESSGLVFDPQTHTIWTHNDGGNPAELFQLDSAGRLLHTLPLSVPNTDWEDITRASTGTLFIGDFGNNVNNRRDLTIYRLHPNQPDQIAAIRFHYGNQRRFPPGRDSLDFDCEAFFYQADSLYLFSKNRGNGPVLVYAVPAQAGEFTTRYVGQIRINRMVTGAAINPAGNRFALLTYGKILLFDLVPGQPILSHPAECIRFSHAQTEGITFTDDTTMVVSNEQRKLFRIRRKR